MEIKGKVHCFFEQSGTFKNEFKKLGYQSFDYDIQNNFNQTDFVVDIFAEIEKAWGGGSSMFDTISSEDLIVAFFPCIYFSATSQMNLYISAVNNRHLQGRKLFETIIKRIENREYFFLLLVKFCAVCVEKNIRMVFENPYSEQTYLKANFIKVPDVIDMNRMERGDYFKKPTAYWFWNCIPTNGFTRQNDKEQKTILKTKSSKQAGLCSEDRSLISSDYARNWICDFIIGKYQEDISGPSLFDMGEYIQ